MTAMAMTDASIAIITVPAISIAASTAVSASCPFLIVISYLITYSMIFLRYFTTNTNNITECADTLV